MYKLLELDFSKPLSDTNPELLFILSYFSFTYFSFTYFSIIYILDKNYFNNFGIDIDDYNLSKKNEIGSYVALLEPIKYLFSQLFIFTFFFILSLYFLLLFVESVNLKTHASATHVIFIAVLFMATTIAACIAPILQIFVYSIFSKKEAILKGDNNNTPNHNSKHVSFVKKLASTYKKLVKDNINLTILVIVIIFLIYLETTFNGSKDILTDVLDKFSKLFLSSFYIILFIFIENLIYCIVEKNLETVTSKKLCLKTDFKFIIPNNSINFSLKNAFLKESASYINRIVISTTENSYICLPCKIKLKVHNYDAIITIYKNYTELVDINNTKISSFKFKSSDFSYEEENTKGSTKNKSKIENKEEIKTKNENVLVYKIKF